MMEKTFYKIKNLNNKTRRKLSLPASVPKPQKPNSATLHVPHGGTRVRSLSPGDCNYEILASRRIGESNDGDKSIKSYPNNFLTPDDLPSGELGIDRCRRLGQYSPGRKRSSSAQLSSKELPRAATRRRSSYTFQNLNHSFNAGRDIIRRGSYASALPEDKRSVIYSGRHTINGIATPFRSQGEYDSKKKFRRSESVCGGTCCKKEEYEQMKRMNSRHRSLPHAFRNLFSVSGSTAEDSGGSIGCRNKSGLHSRIKPPPTPSSIRRRCFIGTDEEESSYRKGNPSNLSNPVKSQDPNHGLLVGAVSLPSKIDRLASEDFRDERDSSSRFEYDEEEDNNEDDEEDDEEEEYEGARDEEDEGLDEDDDELEEEEENKVKESHNSNNKKTLDLIDKKLKTKHRGKKTNRKKSLENPPRKGNKLKRRQAWYSRQRKDLTSFLGPSWSLPLTSNSPKSTSSSFTSYLSPYHNKCPKKGRSKSLTSIDSFGPNSGPSIGSIEMSNLLTVSDRSSSAGGGANAEGSLHRRRKLSTASKVSSSEFFTVSFECLEPRTGPEEYLPVTKGTCLREALTGVCERRGVDIESVNAYLDISRTPLPLLTSETVWLGGRHIRIRAKDDSKSPVRSSSSLGGGATPVPPSRKASANYRTSKSRLFYPSSMSSDDAHLQTNSQSSLVALHSISQSFSGSSSVGQGPSQFQQSQQIFQNAALQQQQSLSLQQQKFNKSLDCDEKNKIKHANKWNGLWNQSPAKETKMDMLISQLDSYSKLGIPKLQHTEPLEDEDEVEEALYSLEESWTTFVGKSDSLPEKIRAQQAAIWELVDTEVAYIHTLRVIQDLFLNCLLNLQSHSILTEIDKVRLFCNIPEIYSANLSFWHEYIVPMLKVSRQSGEPMDPKIMTEGFLKFEEIFQPYSRYCLEQTNCQEYCREQDRSNDIFKAYLAWCETQKDCNRLRLIDILVKPMQRLTKYSLLLKAILKKTESEEQRTTLINMDKKVLAFVSFVNSQLRHREENERLKTIIARIDSYEPVETKDDELERLMQSHCQLDLTSPMPGCTDSQRRYLLFEGDLKLKEGSSSKTDVHAFLFSDMLLLCKNLTKKQGGGEGRVRVIRQPFVIDRLLIYDLSKDSSGLAFIYLNEYSIVVTAFTLHAPDSKIIKSWKEQIQKAKELYEEAKIISLSHQNFYSYDDDDAEYSSGGPASRGGCGGAHESSRSEHLPPPPSCCSSVQQPLSSQSSEEGVGPLAGIKSPVNCSAKDKVSSAALVSPGCRLGGNQSSYPSSPRSERRSPLLKSPTPNTLSVPFPPGQSLPNLSNQISPDRSASPSISSSKRSPSISNAPNRGSSYPPISPKSLRRSAALYNKSNPPLIKTRPVNNSSSLNQSEEIEENEVPSQFSKTVSPSSPSGPNSKRLGKDNRRYHTAGAIEDLKRQDERDSSIHKRLSWNYGQNSTGASGDIAVSSSVPSSGNDSCQKIKAKCLSTDSVQSSSGVSSTGSLQLSIGNDHNSSWESGESEISVNKESSKSQPGASTASGGSLTLMVNSCPILERKSSPREPPPIPPRTNLLLHVSTTYITQDEVTVSSSSNPGLKSDGSSPHPEENKKEDKSDLISLREILLTDSSVESSNV